MRDPARQPVPACLPSHGKAAFTAHPRALAFPPGRSRWFRDHFPVALGALPGRAGQYTGTKAFRRLRSGSEHAGGTAGMVPAGQSWAELGRGGPGLPAAAVTSHAAPPSHRARSAASSRRPARRGRRLPRDKLPRRAARCSATPKRPLEGGARMAKFVVAGEGRPGTGGAAPAAAPRTGSREGQPRQRHLVPGAGRGSSPCLQQSPLSARRAASAGPGQRSPSSRRWGVSLAAAVPPGVASSAPGTLAMESGSPAELLFLSGLTLNSIWCFKPSTVNDKIIQFCCCCYVHR